MMKRENILKRLFCILLVCLCLCCGCGEEGEIVLIGSAEDAGVGEISEEKPRADSGSQGQETEEQKAWIRVYVCGAVMNPGVVEIPEGSRVEDALRAAGGFDPEAGREAVNLADWVIDGQMVYFPTEEEAQEQRIQEEETAAGLVNINTADIAALCTLPGIGESRAADIISYREKNGGFETCEDIMNVSGIKSAVYEKICDKITVK